VQWLERCSIPGPISCRQSWLSSRLFSPIVWSSMLGSQAIWDLGRRPNCLDLEHACLGSSWLFQWYGSRSCWCWRWHWWWWGAELVRVPSQCCKAWLCHRIIIHLVVPLQLCLNILLLQGSCGLFCFSFGGSCNGRLTCRFSRRLKESKIRSCYGWCWMLHVGYFGTEVNAVSRAPMRWFWSFVRPPIPKTK